MLKTEEDVLYQKGASFSAKLDSSNQKNTNGLEENSSNESSDDSESDESFINSIFSSELDADDMRLICEKLKLTSRATAQSEKANRTEESPETDTLPPTTPQHSLIGQNSENSYYTSKEDMSVFDDVNNNRLNLRHANVMYQETNQNEKSGDGSTADYDTTVTSISTTSPATVVVTTSLPTETSSSYIHINEYRAEKPTSYMAKDTTRPEKFTSAKDYRFRDILAANISR